MIVAVCVATTAPSVALILKTKDPAFAELVEGVNIITKHTKPSAQNTRGGIVKKEAPIHISNVMLYDPAQKAGARVTRVRKDGKTERVFKTKKTQGGKK